MSRLDLHPDGLLDRARSGELTERERERLAAHCASCAACRIELSWIEDGVHCEGPSDEDRARGAAAVDALLGQAVRAQPPSRARVGFWQATFAVGLGLLVASAAAALYTEVRAALRERLNEAPASEAAPAQESDRARTKRKRRAVPAAATAAAPQMTAGAAAEPVPVPVVSALQPQPQPQAAPMQQPHPQPSAAAPLPSSPIALPPRAEPSALALHAAPRAREPREVTPVAPAVARAPRAPQPQLGSPAEALFGQANAARDAGRYAEAAAGYAELARLYPGTRGELTARVSHGQLRLQLGQPAQALAAFESYLAALPAGPLAEEARVGVAVCLQRLGRMPEERTAWQDLLERHPASLHAPRARGRLTQLPP